MKNLKEKHDNILKVVLGHPPCTTASWPASAGKFKIFIDNFEQKKRPWTCRAIAWRRRKRAIIW